MIEQNIISLESFILIGNQKLKSRGPIVGYLTDSAPLIIKKGIARYRTIPLLKSKTTMKNYLGSDTASVTCTTPLLAFRSAAITVAFPPLASSIITLPSFTEAFSS